MDMFLTIKEIKVIKLLIKKKVKQENKLLYIINYTKRR